MSFLPIHGPRRKRTHEQLQQDWPTQRAAAGPVGGVIDNAIYVKGRRTSSPATLNETYQKLRNTDDGMAWIGLYRPSTEQITSIAHEFDLHHLAVEDAIAAHQRPKLERYGGTLFAVLRPGRYITFDGRVEFGELHVFVGVDFVVTLRHAESPDLSQARRRLETSPQLLQLGPDAVLYAILDQVVDEYAPVVSGLENDIDDIENQLFDGDPTVTRRIYELTREVMEFQRTAKPLLVILRDLENGFDQYEVDEELQRNLRDVEDHSLQIVDTVNSFRSLLEHAISVHTSLVGQRQNEEMRSMTQANFAQNEQMKKISGWAAILFAPSLIGSIYGMNFHHMPELVWHFGYPYALALMAAIAVGLYLLFRGKHWL